MVTNEEPHAPRDPRRPKRPEVVLPARKSSMPWQVAEPEYRWTRPDGSPWVMPKEFRREYDEARYERHKHDPWASHEDDPRFFLTFLFLMMIVGAIGLLIYYIVTHPRPW